MKKTPAPIQSPPANAPIDPGKVPLADIVRGLTPGQAWKLGGTAVAIIVAAAAVGHRVEGWQRETAISAIVAPKEEKIAALSGRIEKLESAIIEDKNEIRMLSVDLVDAKRFIAFSDKYLTYLSSGENPALSIFADHVCMLYRESQQAEIGVSISTANVAKTLATIPASDSKDLLIAAGFAPDLIDELIELQTKGIQRDLPNISKTVGYSVSPSHVTRVGPFTTGSANNQAAQNVAADVTRRLSAQSGQLVKLVTFRFGGKNY